LTEERTEIKSQFDAKSETQNTLTVFACNFEFSAYSNTKSGGSGFFQILTTIGFVAAIAAIDMTIALAAVADAFAGRALEFAWTASC
jgi:hypothetical protein